MSVILTVLQIKLFNLSFRNLLANIPSLYSLQFLQCFGCLLITKFQKQRVEQLKRLLQYSEKSSPLKTLKEASIQRLYFIYCGEIWMHYRNISNERTFVHIHFVVHSD